MEIHTESDVLLVRQRATQFAVRLGFENRDLAKIGAAVSEIACNALQHAGGGKVEFRIGEKASHKMFLICSRDEGPGIDGLTGLLSPSAKGRAMLAGTGVTRWIQ